MTLEVAILGSYAALINLPYRGPKAHPQVTSLMHTTIQVWQKARAIYKSDSVISPHMPLWGNPLLSHLYGLPDPQLWAVRGIVTIKHIYQEGSFSSSETLKAKHNIPASMKFRYYQLKHAVQAQFPGPLTLQIDAVERLLIAKIMDKPLSSLYFYLSIEHMTSLTKVLLNGRLTSQS